MSRVTNVSVRLSHFPVLSLTLEKSTGLAAGNKQPMAVTLAVLPWSQKGPYKVQNTPQILYQRHETPAKHGPRINLPK